MGKRIVHIGFPKTATTYLQWRVFPRLKELNYVDYHLSRSIFQPIIYADPLDYSTDKIRSEIDGLGSNLLFSFESLAGSPFYYKGIGRSTIPKALKELGFTSVIITVRRQTEAIDSYYRQYVVQGGTLSFRNWLDLDDRRPLPQKYFSLGYLEYDTLIDKYHKTFGPDNVLVLSQESLKEDSEEFIETIKRFTGSELEDAIEQKSANTSLSNASIGILRFFNHFTYSSVNPYHILGKWASNRPIWKIFAVIIDPYFLRFFSKRKSFLSSENKRRLENFYEKSNQNLAKTDLKIDYLKK